MSGRGNGRVSGSGDSPGQQGRRLLDDALRLFDVVQAVRPDPGGPAGAVGTDRSREPGGGHGGPSCAFCPLCRAFDQLRAADPEGVERLTAAVADLVGAVRDLLGGVRGEQPAREAADGPGKRDEPGETGEPEGTRATGAPHVDVQPIELAEEAG